MYQLILSISGVMDCPRRKLEVTEENVTKVVAGTYHVIGQNPQGPWEIFQALVIGFKNQSSLIYMILFVGAAVYMITETKAIDTIL